MGFGGRDEWERSSTFYTEGQVEAVLRDCRVEIVDETDTDFQSYCPWHGNFNSPAFCTSKTTGLSYCFNPACEQAINLVNLVRELKGLNLIEANRFILKRGNGETIPLKDRLAAAKKKFEFKEFDPNFIEARYQDFWSNDKPQEYMYGRHFNEETLRYFKVGYSAPMEMVGVPMYDPNGMPIGIVGRSIDPSIDPKFRFKNSKKLPKSYTIWNLHNAKRHETIILTEASFDAMRLHQAGYPNVGALLGGSLSPHQIEYLQRHFSKIVIMGDNDQPNFHKICRKCKKAGYEMCQGHIPGRELGIKIANSVKGIRVMWAVYDDANIYPSEPLEGYRTKAAKDAGDMTDDEIRQCLHNAIPHLEFMSWQVD